MNSGWQNGYTAFIISPKIFRKVVSSSKFFRGKTCQNLLTYYFINIILRKKKLYASRCRKSLLSDTQLSDARTLSLPMQQNTEIAKTHIFQPKATNAIPLPNSNIILFFKKMIWKTWWKTIQAHFKQIRLSRLFVETAILIQNTTSHLPQLMIQH